MSHVRHRHFAIANETIDGLVRDFAVHPVDQAICRRARELLLTDFEDAVVASVGEATGSEYVVTRKVEDSAGSPILANTPLEFLEETVNFEGK
ncbi:MAG: PIN domain-containing protein [Limisphaerales bacterium]